MLLQSRQLSGVLIINESQRTRYGFCKNGGLVGWSSNPVSEEECLGALLCANKQITESQLAESLKLMEELSIRQGDALVLRLPPTATRYAVPQARVAHRKCARAARPSRDSTLDRRRCRLPRRGRAARRSR